MELRTLQFQIYEDIFRRLFRFCHCTSRALDIVRRAHQRLHALLPVTPNNSIILSAFDKMRPKAADAPNLLQRRCDAAVIARGEDATTMNKRVGHWICMSFGKTNYRVGGTRGGADQFNWEDVKNDKYRENYLGHSVQAPVGRWQRGKDLTWYARANKSQRSEALQKELALAKQQDEDLMNEALGIAPKRRHVSGDGLTVSEMKELLKRGESERDGMNVERIEGLGAAPVEAAGFEIGQKRTLAERYKDQVASGKADTTYALPGTIADQMTESEINASQKKARKAEKEAKKLKKKEKKERKKEKKAKRNHVSGLDDEKDKQPRHSRKNANHFSRSRSRSRRTRALSDRSHSGSPGDRPRQRSLFTRAKRSHSRSFGRHHRQRIRTSRSPARRSRSR
ncbi:hypothetical protein PsorP6_009014 [Peronosclerospora sorghi]|uniref:Uncharacterized protein n=1 Tax=Peronosclerospora sorghi TaxID=230839 RepID=A0ACC0VYZ2_9STRA|nr:hypothetical protein PsorP6_009014 [Peronosclerospora sorghi]